MGLGCNAVGVTGCRIIDSPRERTIALLTNSLMPCNGRFPTVIALITAFLCRGGGGIGAAAVLCCCIVFAVGMTFAVSRLLSAVFLRGRPSSFTLELPPFRAPRVKDIIVRSVLDRTVFVLGRAVSVAAPCGLILWLCAFARVGDATLLSRIASYLDGVGNLLGVDGAFITGLIFALPANEITMPIALMCYTGAGTLAEGASSGALGDILLSNGWNTASALCAVILVLFHSPCATTLLTVKKETGSLRAVLAAWFIPTVVGVLLCFAVMLIFRMM